MRKIVASYLIKRLEKLEEENTFLQAEVLKNKDLLDMVIRIYGGDDYLMDVINRALANKNVTSHDHLTLVSLKMYMIKERGFKYEN